ncbi:MAG: glycosyltransferase family 4 protein [Syntrophomonadaceae bacterium]|nr:glycosyltransferase family 4 protein [Syntrophomonadaceae bacterium]
MGKIRLLHVIGGGEVGGAEELVLTMMKLIDREKFEPHLVCLCPGPFAALAEASGFKSTVIPMKHKLDITTITPVREYLRKNRIGIVHSHGVRANLVARVAAKRESLPVVTTVHSVLRYDYPSAVEAFLARWLTMITNRYTDRFIAISKAIEDEIHKMGVPAHKVQVIYNGLDLTKFKAPGNPGEIKRNLKLDPNRPIVSMISRLHPVKGHEYFIRAAYEVLKSEVNAQFLIIGEGDYRARIEQWVDELGIKDSVIVPGYYSPIEDIYAISDILCVPSIMEGLGMVILEAMNFNVPVIASNTGGIPEIIHDGVDGLLVQPKDYLSLARNIIKVLNDRQLAARLIAHGQKKVQSFTLETMTRRVENIYLELG